METIGLTRMAEILKTCETIMGRFGGSNDWHTAYQLTGVRRLPLKANGKNVGERTEWHTFTIGELPDALPEHLMHVSGGEGKAFLRLILDEINDKRRDNLKNGCESVPKILVKSAFWGHDGTRKATFSIAAGADVSHDLSGDVYHVQIGDYHLTVAGFGIEPAGKWGRCLWSTEGSALDHNSADSATFHYTVDPRVDSVARDTRKVA